MSSESAVEAALAELPSGWTVLEDVPEPGRSTHEIDFVVVGPPGVFTVDATMWTGRFEVRNGELLDGGRDRSSRVEIALREAASVHSLLGSAATTCPAVTGVVCFASPERIYGSVRGSLVCTTSNVVEVLTGQPAVLAQPEVDQAVAALTRGASTPAASSASVSASPVRRFVGLAALGVSAFVIVRSGAVGDVMQWLSP